MPTFYGAIDLSKNELRNAVIQNLASAPGSPVQGQLYFDSTGKILYWHNGTTWVSASGASPASAVTNSAVGDAQAVGTSLNYARQDHVHGREAFGAVTPETSFGLAAANGSAATVARSDHTHGTPAAPAAAPGPASTVTTEAIGVASVVGTATTYAREDHRHGWGAATTPLDMGSFSIVNLANPTSGTDGANKNYVDNAVTGMSWKNPVRLTSGNTNFGVLSGLQTMDGVTMVAGDRILLTGQSTASSNGIYVAAAGAWSRATDNDSAAEMLNASVYVSEGTTYADTAWVCTTNAPITIGTTPLTWAQFAGSGSVVAGAGMTQAGNTLNVIAGDTSLVVNADEVHVNTAVIATVASLASYQAADSDLSALAALSTTGIEVRTGAGTQATRSIAGTAPVSVTNGDGVAGNPTVAVSNFTAGAAGTVPASGGGASTFLRADGTWASPPGTGLAKFTATLTGTASPEVVTHNLNTRDVMVTVLNGASPYTAVEVDWDATTVNTVTIRYNPNLGAGYRVVVIG